MHRFLVIDDSSTIQKVVDLAFAPYSIDILTASSYLEAINEVGHQPPDLVIADASLPGIKGAKDYANLQKQLHNVPFIILLGSYDGVDQASFHQYGFRLFLAKPFEAGDLISSAWQAIGQEVAPRVAASPSGPPPPPINEAVGDVPPPPKTHTLPPTKPAAPLFDGAPDVGKADPRLAETVLSPPREEPPNSNVSRIDISDVDVDDVGDDPFGESFPEADDHVNQPSIDQEQDQDGELYEGKAFDSERYRAAELDNHLYDDDSETISTPPKIARTEQDTIVSTKPGSIEHQGEFAPPPPPPSLSSLPDKAPQSVEKPSEPAPFVSGEVAGLLDPFLKEEMAKIVEKTVTDYCERHFATLAREVLRVEIEELLKEKSRLLVDN